MIENFPNDPMDFYMLSYILHSANFIINRDFDRVFDLDLQKTLILTLCKFYAELSIHHYWHLCIPEHRSVTLKISSKSN